MINKSVKKILICGGGNSAHVMAALAPKNYEVNVLTTFKDEHLRWGNSIKAIREDYEGGNVERSVNMVSNDPAKVTPGAEMILISCPAYCHKDYLEAVSPHIDVDNVIIGTLPAEGGFEYESRHILRKHFSDEQLKNFTLFGTETLPWACRVKDYGKSVEILGSKFDIDVAVRGARPDVATQMLQEIIGKQPTLVPVPTFTSATLQNVNSVWHTCITYGAYRDWDRKTPFPEKLPFYEGIDAYTGDLITATSDEICHLRDEIMKQYPDYDLKDVRHLKEWMLRSYDKDIGDKSSLYRMIKTNYGYRGLVHPMVGNDTDGYLPDYSYRYFTEDLPCGLIVTRAIGIAFGVEMPTLDKIITNNQELMGKEYMVDGKLIGKDIGECRIPQNYGLNTPEELYNMYKNFW